MHQICHESREGNFLSAVPRTVEGVVLELMKEKILDAATEYQIGGLPGHCPQDHIYVYKSVVRERAAKKMVTVLSCLDILQVMLKRSPAHSNCTPLSLAKFR